MTAEGLQRTGLVHGKTALVTGGGSGIGRAICQLMQREGASVVGVADIDLDAAEATAQSLASASTTAHAIRCDVSSRTDVDAMVDEVMSTYGRLDCAVNNAAIVGPMAPASEYSDTDWNAVLDVNLTGVFYCLRAELRAMGSNGGAIVNLSSGSVLGPVPGLAAYVASKAGVLQLTRTVAGECVGDGVRVNAVLPGITRTPLLVKTYGEDPPFARSPMGRLGEPEEIAEAVVWLCSDRASFVHGTSLVVDGGRHSFVSHSS